MTGLTSALAQNISNSGRPWFIREYEMVGGKATFPILRKFKSELFWGSGASIRRRVNPMAVVRLNYLFRRL